LCEEKDSRRWADFVAVRDCAKASNDTSCISKPCLSGLFSLFPVTARQDEFPTMIDSSVPKLLGMNKYLRSSTRLILVSFGAKEFPYRTRKTNSGRYRVMDSRSAARVGTSQAVEY
jgi:hypothetical protein